MAIISPVLTSSLNCLACSTQPGREWMKSATCGEAERGREQVRVSSNPWAPTCIKTPMSENHSVQGFPKLHWRYVIRWYTLSCTCKVFPRTSLTKYTFCKRYFRKVGLETTLGYTLTQFSDKTNVLQSEDVVLVSGQMHWLRCNTKISVALHFVLL